MRNVLNYRDDAIPCRLDAMLDILRIFKGTYDEHRGHKGRTCTCTHQPAYGRRYYLQFFTWKGPYANQPQVGHSLLGYGLVESNRFAFLYR